MHLIFCIIQQYPVPVLFSIKYSLNKKQDFFSNFASIIVKLVCFICDLIMNIFKPDIKL